MTRPGFAVDPAPDRDLPSDIALRLYLDGLTPADVLVDREPTKGGITEKWVRAARQNQYDRQHPRKD